MLQQVFLGLYLNLLVALIAPKVLVHKYYTCRLLGVFAHPLQNTDLLISCKE